MAEKHAEVCYGPRGKWTAVPLVNYFSSPDELEGLVGIEVLHDYDLLNRPSEVGSFTKVKKRKKPTGAEPTAAVKVKDDLEKEGKRRKTAEAEGWEEQEWAWSGLPVPTPVQTALRELGFTSPTPIQALTLPAAIQAGRDVLGAAETGSGKTLAFGIPILHGILRDRAKDAIRDEEEEVEEMVQASSGRVTVVSQQPMETERREGKFKALILEPTRELAIQVKNHLDAVAKYTDIKIAVVVGGMSQEKQERVLRKNPEIVVATPGRLWELIQSGNPHLAGVQNIRYLVIDETDRMLEQGHFQELQQLLEILKEGPRRQTLVFSATLTLVHQLPQRLMAKKRVSMATPAQKIRWLAQTLGMKPNPKVVDLSGSTGTAQTLSEAQIACSREEKDFYLYYFLMMYPARTLVFCNSIDAVRRLTNLFTLLKCEPLPLHSQLHQKQRLKNLEHFQANEQGLLIATDVAARGLDIPNIKHVIHYQVPRTSENYVHRSGRTARASQEGLALMLVEPAEAANYWKLCKTLNRTQDLASFPVDMALMKEIQQRVLAARELEKLQHKWKRNLAESNWKSQTLKEMELLDEDELTSDGDDSDCASHQRDREKKLLTSKQQQLNKLLDKPLLTKRNKYPTQLGPIEPNAQEDEMETDALQVFKTTKVPLLKIPKVKGRPHKKQQAKKLKKDAKKKLKKGKQKKRGKH